MRVSRNKYAPNNKNSILAALNGPKTPSANTNSRMNSTSDQLLKLNNVFKMYDTGKIGVKQFESTVTQDIGIRSTDAFRTMIRTNKTGFKLNDV